MLTLLHDRHHSLFHPRPHVHADSRFPVFALSHLLGFDLIESQFRHLMRVAVTVREGTISSSTLLKRLRSGSRKNATYAAFREVGRVIRTVQARSGRASVRPARVVHRGRTRTSVQTLTRATPRTKCGLPQRTKSPHPPQNRCRSSLKTLEQLGAVPESKIDAAITLLSMGRRRVHARVHAG
ncbi:Tn3 family transposase [Streptomyces halstedii]|uniref:Tn3 family transposase n=1 Tax=Streptomyces halstedii TaxID=1944 RepID=UPI00345FFE7A